MVLNRLNRNINCGDPYLFCALTTKRLSKSRVLLGSPFPFYTFQVQWPVWHTKIGWRVLLSKNHSRYLYTHFFCNPMRPNTEKSHQQLGSIENLSSSSSFFFSFPAKVKYILQSKECPRIGMHLGNSVLDYYFYKYFYRSLIFSL